MDDENPLTMPNSLLGTELLTITFDASILAENPRRHIINWKITTAHSDTLEVEKINK